MQQQTKSSISIGNLAYKYSLLQGIMVFISLFMIAMAGPETSANGFFFGTGSVIMGLITFAIAPVSLGVFLVYTIKYRGYKNSDTYFILSIIFQAMNIAYMTYYGINWLNGS